MTLSLRRQEIEKSRTMDGDCPMPSFLNVFPHRGFSSFPHIAEKIRSATWRNFSSILMQAIMYLVLVRSGVGKLNRGSRIEQSNSGQDCDWFA